MYEGRSSELVVKTTFSNYRGFLWLTYFTEKTGHFWIGQKSTLVQLMY